MPDTDPGDVFLQHREAVLEALLSDPSLNWTGTPEPEQTRLDGVDEDPFTPGLTPASGNGPKASERILALLNGQNADTDTERSDYVPADTDYAQTPGTEDNTQSSASSSDSRASLARRGAPIRALLPRIREPKVALAIAAACTLVVALAILTSGGETEPTNNPAVLATGTGSPDPLTPTQPATPTTAVGSPIQIKSAQSHCPPGGTPAMDAFAGTGKAWSCPRAYKVDGQILIIDLGRSYRVDSIGVVPGWDASTPDGVDQWVKYRTASRVSYRFDDANATTYTQQTLDQRALVITKVSPEISATKIVVTVLESKGDPVLNSIALSSMVVTGH
ncbi:hypothetical protein [Nocardia jejuensis]|uniref:hypothetical protein n=1 Tax=Nocardia jejuensis TaxID=328049 RepID=UPI0008357D57|nr:hypothetical protein [Nocardia jejuensis]